MLFINQTNGFAQGLFKNTQLHKGKQLSQGQQKTLELTGTNLIEGDNDTTLSEIKAKLQNGYELSPSELEYLHENAPDLYEEAMRMISLRKEIEARLKQCKSKEAVSSAQSEINSRIASECGVSGTKKCDLNQSLMYQRRINTAKRCYVKFCKTADFRNLADTEAEYTRLKAQAQREKLGDRIDIQKASAHSDPTEQNNQPLAKNPPEDNISDTTQTTLSPNEQKKLAAADKKIKKQSDNNTFLYQKNYVQATSYQQTSTLDIIT